MVLFFAAGILLPALRSAIIAQERKGPVIITPVLRPDNESKTAEPLQSLTSHNAEKDYLSLVDQILPAPEKIIREPQSLLTINHCETNGTKVAATVALRSQKVSTVTNPLASAKHT